MGKLIKTQRDVRTLVERIYQRTKATRDVFDEHENLAAFKAQHPELSKRLYQEFGDAVILEMFRAAAKRDMTVPVDSSHAKQLALVGIPVAIPGCIKFIDDEGKRKFVSTLRATDAQWESHEKLQLANIAACNEALRLSKRLRKFIKSMRADNLEDALRIHAKRGDDPKKSA